MDEATFTLEQAGFQVTTTPKEDESVDEGTVLQQDPAGGTKQQKGATITLTIAVGPDTCLLYTSTKRQSSCGNRGINEVSRRSSPDSCFRTQIRIPSKEIL